MQRLSRTLSPLEWLALAPLPPNGRQSVRLSCVGVGVTEGSWLLVHNSHIKQRWFSNRPNARLRIAPYLLLGHGVPLRRPQGQPSVLPGERLGCAEEPGARHAAIRVDGGDLPVAHGTTWCVGGVHPTAA